MKIFTGTTDGSIHQWNVESGKCTLIISVDSVIILLYQEILLVKLNFWDGKVGVVLHSFEEHKVFFS